MTTDVADNLKMPPKRKPPHNASDPRGKFGAFLRHWVDKHHAGDETRLATSLGLSPRTIRSWFTGRYGPMLADLDRVAEAMGYEDWGKLGNAVAAFHRRTK